MKKRSNGIKQHAPRTLQERELEMIRGGSEVKADRDTLVSPNLMMQIIGNMK